ASACCNCPCRCNRELLSARMCAAAGLSAGEFWEKADALEISSAANETKKQITIRGGQTSLLIMYLPFTHHHQKNRDKRDHLRPVTKGHHGGTVDFWVCAGAARICSVQLPVLIATTKHARGLTRKHCCTSIQHSRFKCGISMRFGCFLLAIVTSAMASSW